MPGSKRACCVLIRGIVQGVGFRPFVYHMAVDHGIAGWILNDTQGVTIHAEGAPEQVDAFIESVREKAPSAAQIESLEAIDADVVGLSCFQIRSSSDQAVTTAKISPDLPICDACLKELFQSGGRRYLYPYINCTACGPRYSIIEALPYDRPNTTMKGLGFVRRLPGRIPGSRRSSLSRAADGVASPADQTTVCKPAARSTPLVWTRSSKRLSNCAEEAFWRSRESAGITWPVTQTIPRAYCDCVSESFEKRNPSR